MGNGVGKLTVCFTGGNHVGHQKDMDMVMFDPIDDLGHSFCYVRPDPTRISSSKVHSEEETTTFRSISGASVSANTATPLSTSLIDLHSYNSIDRASVFESSTSFASISLQAQRRNSGPITADGGFMSGPLERGFQSGPLLSGPLDQVQFQRSYSHGGFAFRRRSRRGSVIGLIRKAVSKTISRGQNSVSVVAPVKGSDWEKNNHSNGGGGGYNYGNKKESAAVRSSHVSSLEDDESSESQDLQWAQGKAGEDRVHVVVSEEQGWVFVGIYDGFNGPDAPDFLVSNLYPAIDKELRELLRDDNLESSNSESPESKTTEDDHEPGRVAEDSEDKKRRRNKNDSIRARNGKKWKNQRRWKCEFDRERLELKQELNSKGGGGSGGGNHPGILKALYRGLKKTEEAYLDITDMMLVENPELALMGSCVLVMLMKGEDVYVMNVGDSRAVLARKPEPDIWRQDLERINEETLYDLQVSCRDDDEDYDEDHDRNNPTTSLTALQLSMDHSTSIQEEVERIKSEHPDDPCAILNDRVKGSLKVTRAFGAGFLKQPKWNNALLEMFRIDYVGNSPYLNCLPYLCHHRLGPRDRFLILSSDGLYQYFTNEEAVSEVELFFRWSPEGDPAQHLVEEVLLRAARKAGLDFHELLEIPQGDRRRYHDDISIIVISLQGRIWRSCV